MRKAIVLGTYQICSKKCARLYIVLWTYQICSQKYIQICLNKRPRLYSYVGLLIKFAQKIRKAINLWTYQIFSKKCHGYCLIYLSNLLTKMSKAYVGLLIKFAKIIHNAIVLWSYQICYKKCESLVNLTNLLKKFAPKSVQGYSFGNLSNLL